MAKSLRLHTLREMVTNDKKSLVTFASYIIAFAVYVNATMFDSPVVGTIILTIYFSINATFLGRAFFEKEDAFIRLVLGILSLVVLLGFVGWLALIVYNLDAVRTTLVLLAAATFCSLSNRRAKGRNGVQ